MGTATITWLNNHPTTEKNLISECFMNKSSCYRRNPTLNIAFVLLIVQLFLNLISVNAVPTQASSGSIDMKDVNSVCGRRFWKEPSGRIVGGTQAKFAHWPWMVVFLEEYMPGEYANSCGASLLNEYWVVTAAHCVYNKTVNMKLRLGDLDLLHDDSLAYEDIGIKKVVIYDKYDHKNHFNDIALLQLNKSVTFQPHILPICLPNDDDSFVGKSATATGWGATTHKGRGAAILLQVDLPILSNSDCQRMYKKVNINRNFPNTLVCAGKEQGAVDACEGDSGGPLAIYDKKEQRYVLIGITSWGVGCGAANKPGVYTRVSAFRNWINKVISKH